MTQRDHRGHMKNCRKTTQPGDKHSSQSSQNRRKYLTRDALIDVQSCCTHTTNGGNCTHYHNHYEAPRGVRGRYNYEAVNDPVVSERLIK